MITIVQIRIISMLKKTGLVALNSLHISLKLLHPTHVIAVEDVLVNNTQPLILHLLLNNQVVTVHAINGDNPCPLWFIIKLRIPMLIVI